MPTKKPTRKPIETMSPKKPTRKPIETKSSKKSRESQQEPRETRKKPASAPGSPASQSIQAHVQSILRELKQKHNPKILAEMGPRYGVHVKAGKAIGVAMSDMVLLAKERLREMAAQESRTTTRATTRTTTRATTSASRHALALALWETGIYEARMVASMVDDPALVTSAQMDRWCSDFDNWGLCDTVCFKLFDRVDPRIAFGKVEQWSRRKEEFTRRGAFALLWSLALHDKRRDADDDYLRCLPIIEQASTDDRNFVRKGIAMALGALGRRSSAVRAAAKSTANRLSESQAASARWIGRDASRQLAKGAGGTGET